MTQANTAAGSVQPCPFILLAYPRQEHHFPRAARTGLGVAEGLLGQLGRIGGRRVEDQHMRRGTVIAGVACVVLTAAPSAAAPVAAAPRPPVIGFVSMDGVNPLHADFAAPPGAVRPAGLPPAVEVRLPRTGSFDQRLQALREGPLGQMRPGVLYHLQGTRLLFVAAGDQTASAVGAAPSGVGLNGRELGQAHAELAHDTGVLGAALSARMGTAPQAWGVSVVGADDAAYGWTADQAWIDVTTRSGANIGEQTCFAVEEVRRVHANGRIVIAAIGNTETAAIAATTPGLAPEVFHVGGVDGDGRPWTPRPSTTDPLLNAVMPARPYETGDLFAFKTSDYASLTGDQDFGGTSGAAPRTAGRAALLIDQARRLLGDRNGGAEPRGRAGRVKRGPLSDGAFTRAELEQLLRSTAAPSLPASAARHAAEGYGGHDETTTKVALRVLAGQEDLPARPEEDAAQARLDAARAAILNASGC